MTYLPEPLSRDIRSISFERPISAIIPLGVWVVEEDDSSILRSWGIRRA